jgi:4-amino-4-deoxy-L-arabinose transferase-like glycosyltransferase
VSDSQASRIWLGAILLAYMLLGLGYSRVTPLGEAPDEVDHFRYAQFLVLERRFPVMQPVAADNETMEANQPPLYYLLAALLGAPGMAAEPLGLEPNRCFSFDPADPGRPTFYIHGLDFTLSRSPFLGFYLMRLLSVALGAATVGVTFWIGLALGLDGAGALAATAILAFNSQFLFITASVNNDNLAALLGAAILAAAIAAARRPTTAHFAWLGLTFGLGALTKFGLLSLAPVAGLAILLPAWQERSWRRAVVGLGWLVGLTLLLAGWWYVRAQILYGDPLAWRVHLMAKGEQVARTTPFAWADLVEFARIHFQSFCGWLNIKPPVWSYLLPLAITILATIGWLLPNRWLAQRARWRKPGLLLGLTALAALVIYISLFRYIQTINWSGYQGRLAFPAVAAVAVLLAFGLLRLGGSRLASAAGALLAISAVGALAFVVAPAYRPAAVYQPPLPALSHDPQPLWPCARYAAGVDIERITVAQEARPGAELLVGVSGFAWGEPSRQWLMAEVIAPDGARVGQAQHQWSNSPGSTLTATLAIPISVRATPGRALLRLGLAHENGNWLVATSPAGRALPLPPDVATIKLLPTQPPTAQPSRPLAATFGDTIALEGYDQERADGRLHLTLYWRAASDIGQDYTRFVHLLGYGDQILAQADGPPQNGYYPTSIWAAGERVLDELWLELPAGMPAELRLAIGFYAPATVERLPVLGPNGDRQPDDRFILQEIDLEPLP